jgi:hypothetical protein
MTAPTLVGSTLSGKRLVLKAVVITGRAGPTRGIDPRPRMVTMATPPSETVAMACAVSGCGRRGLETPSEIFFLCVPAKMIT